MAMAMGWRSAKRFHGNGYGMEKWKDIPRQRRWDGEVERDSTVMAMGWRSRKRLLGESDRMKKNQKKDWQIG